MSLGEVKTSLRKAQISLLEVKTNPKRALGETPTSHGRPKPGTERPKSVIEAIIIH